MKKIISGFIILTLLGIPMLVGRAQAPGSGDSANKNQQSNIEELMQRKQKIAHETLDALIMKDFKRINKNAGSLVALSKAAEFQVHRTPLYAQYTAEFQESAAKLGQNARDRNAEGTTRAFTELVNSCIRCHDYIREGKKGDADIFFKMSASPF